METDYLLGSSDGETRRLIAQASFLADYVFAGVSFGETRTLYEPGIGVGAQTRIIRERWPHVRVLGVDVSEQQIDRARRVLARDLERGDVELWCAPADRAPLPSHVADAAFVCFTLAHVRDPVSVLRECARIVRPGGTLFAVDVYNASVVIEPHQPVIDRYWSALSESLRRIGGSPNVGPRLAEHAASAGLHVESHGFVPVLGDARDQNKRRETLRYFRSLFQAVEPYVRAGGLFADRDFDALWAAWDVVERAGDALACHALGKLVARVADAA